MRKVLVVLHHKGIAYEIDPIIPFMGDARFTEISPLRRIPVLVDDRVTLSDSTVICEYLEERWPEPALLPRDPADRARARWLEEYADTRMGEVFIWRLFNEVAINPSVWGRPTDPAVLRRALDEEIPSILDYLEPQLPAAGFLFGALSLADVSSRPLRGAHDAHADRAPPRGPGRPGRPAHRRDLRDGDRPPRDPRQRTGRLAPRNLRGRGG